MLRLRKYNFAVVIGVGGVGSWVAFNLGLSGQVKTLILFDDDAIESTNLNRTPFRMDQVGIEKVWAMKELILERRVVNVVCFTEKFTTNSIKMLKTHCDQPIFTPKSTIIFDCRDEVFKDLKSANCKKWKVGYDGLEITIDGNPDDTVVMGVSNGYAVTPSFICPSQLLANLVVSNALADTSWYLNKEDPNKDKFGQFNKILTVDSREILPRLYELEHQTVENENGRTETNREQSPQSKREDGQHNDQEERTGDIVEQLSVSAD